MAHEGDMMQGSTLQMSNQLETENKNQYLDDYYIDDQEKYIPDTIGIEVPGPYVTSFVCLLVPRFEEHTLVGDLSDSLHTWMRDICISFGWNLKFIEISPNYLHWIMTVKITSSPAEFMNIVRKTTSNKIFDEFPRFSEQNMSKKFWAPYYYVGVGNVPYSKPSIQSFIDQIRMEQGFQ
jgi:REP element-mobilizing transposase RayT